MGYPGCRRSRSMPHHARVAAWYRDVIERTHSMDELDHLALLLRHDTTHPLYRYCKPCLGLRVLWRCTGHNELADLLEKHHPLASVYLPRHLPQSYS